MLTHCAARFGGFSEGPDDIRIGPSSGPDSDVLVK